MKKFFIVAVLLLAGFAAKAQPYNWSLGVRGGVESGSLNLRHYIGDSNAFDIAASFSFNPNGWELSGIYEWTYDIIGESLDFYYGFGPQFGAFKGEEKSYVAISAVGVVGLEYAVSSVPLAVFVDYRPRLTCSFGNGLGLGYTDLGLGLRIYF